MKLRHKKTGVIKELTIYAEKFHLDDIGFAKGETIVYNSLTELNDEWEDYEEPKKYWYITSQGNLHCIQNVPDECDRNHKSFGNFFETEEEAKKAVERLRAWKRLKDRGFRFKRYVYNDILEGRIGIEAQFNNDGKVDKDLDLLFSGEDD